MSSPEDQYVLGLGHEGGTTRRSTAVSQALRAISDAVGSGKDRWFNSCENGGYRIVVASDRARRERAFALAYRVYRHAGYIREDRSKLCISSYDASAQTLTLLAEDARGNDCATISLIFDSPAGLPCDEIYRSEVNGLRGNGSLLAEVTRLAIGETCPDAKKLLLHLFNHCYIFARFVRAHSDLLIEVNPRHVNYYQHILRFKQTGPERPCSRVQGAPAVLLRLNFDEIEAAVKVTGCTEGRDRNGRRLHRYPYSKSEEAAIASFLAQSHKPMSKREARYFGLEEAQSALNSALK